MATLPPQPVGEMFFGHLRWFQRSPLDFLEACARQYGDVVLLRFVHKRVFLLSHPDDIERVFLTEHAHFEKSDAARGAASVFGRGLFNSGGELWKRQRQRLHPMFTPARVERLADLVREETEQLIAGWHPDVPIDLSREMSQLSLRIIMRALFGVGTGPGYNEISPHIEVCLERFRQEFPMPQSLSLWLPVGVPTRANRRFLAARRGLRNVASALIRAARRRALESGAPSLLEPLFNKDAVGEDDGGQTIDEAVTLLLTGHDTVAAALSWTWILLAKDPAARERLEQEIRRTHASAGDIAGGWTRNVVMEALRLRPPAWGTNRRVLSDMQFRGFRVPKGSTVAMSQWVVHRDPRFFPDPDRFDPQRWEGVSQTNLPRFAYFPFGGGPRTCIGRQFALMELTSAVATIARRFRLVPLSKANAPPQLSITMHPGGPVLMRPIPARP